MADDSNRNLMGNLTSTQDGKENSLTEDKEPPIVQDQGLPCRNFIGETPDDKTNSLTTVKGKPITQDQPLPCKNFIGENPEEKTHSLTTDKDEVGPITQDEGLLPCPEQNLNQGTLDCLPNANAQRLTNLLDSKDAEAVPDKEKLATDLNIPPSISDDLIGEKDGLTFQKEEELPTDLNIPPSISDDLIADKDGLTVPEKEKLPTDLNIPPSISDDLVAEKDGLTFQGDQELATDLNTPPYGDDSLGEENGPVFAPSNTDCVNYSLESNASSEEQSSLHIEGEDFEELSDSKEPENLDLKDLGETKVPENVDLKDMDETKGPENLDLNDLSETKAPENVGLVGTSFPIPDVISSNEILFRIEDVRSVGSDVFKDAQASEDEPVQKDSNQSSVKGISVKSRQSEDEGELSNSVPKLRNTHEMGSFLESCSSSYTDHSVFTEADLSETSITVESGDFSQSLIASEDSQIQSQVILDVDIKDDPHQSKEKLVPVAVDDPQGRTEEFLDVPTKDDLQSKEEHALASESDDPQSQETQDPADIDGSETQETQDPADIDSSITKETLGFAAHDDPLSQIQRTHGHASKYDTQSKEIKDLGPQKSLDPIASTDPESQEPHNPANGVQPKESHNPDNGVQPKESHNPANGAQTKESHHPDNGPQTKESHNPANGAQTKESDNPETKMIQSKRNTPEIFDSSGDMSEPSDRLGIVPSNTECLPPSDSTESSFSNISQIEKIEVSTPESSFEQSSEIDLAKDLQCSTSSSDFTSSIREKSSFNEATGKMKMDKPNEEALLVNPAQLHEIQTESALPVTKPISFHEVIGKIKMDKPNEEAQLDEIQTESELPVTNEVDFTNELLMDVGKSSSSLNQLDEISAATSSTSVVFGSKGTRAVTPVDMTTDLQNSSIEESSSFEENPLFIDEDKMSWEESCEPLKKNAEKSRENQSTHIEEITPVKMVHLEDSLLPNLKTDDLTMGTGEQLLVKTADDFPNSNKAASKNKDDETESSDELADKNSLGFDIEASTNKEEAESLLDASLHDDMTATPDQDEEESKNSNEVAEKNSLGFDVTLDNIETFSNHEEAESLLAASQGFSLHDDMSADPEEADLATPTVANQYRSSSGPFDSDSTTVTNAAVMQHKADGSQPRNTLVHPTNCALEESGKILKSKDSTTTTNAPESESNENIKQKTKVHQTNSAADTASTSEESEEKSDKNSKDSTTTTDLDSKDSTSTTDDQQKTPKAAKASKVKERRSSGNRRRSINTVNEEDESSSEEDEDDDQITSLSKDFEIIHKKGTNRFVCSCGFAAEEQYFHTHLVLNHLIFKPFRCAYCKRCLLNKGFMKNHIREKHRDDGKRPLLKEWNLVGLKKAEALCQRARTNGKWVHNAKKNMAEAEAAKYSSITVDTSRRKHHSEPIPIAPKPPTQKSNSTELPILKFVPRSTRTASSDVDKSKQMPADYHEQCFQFTWLPKPWSPPTTSQDNQILPSEEQVVPVMPHQNQSRDQVTTSTYTYEHYVSTYQQTTIPASMVSLDNLGSGSVQQKQQNQSTIPSGMGSENLQGISSFQSGSVQQQQNQSTVPACMVPENPKGFSSFQSGGVQQQQQNQSTIPSSMVSSKNVQVVNSFQSGSVQPQQQNPSTIPAGMVPENPKGFSSFQSSGVQHQQNQSTITSSMVSSKNVQVVNSYQSGGVQPQQQDLSTIPASMVSSKNLQGGSIYQYAKQNPSTIPASMVSSKNLQGVSSYQYAKQNPSTIPAGMGPVNLQGVSSYQSGGAQQQQMVQDVHNQRPKMSTASLSISPPRHSASNANQSEILPHHLSLPKVPQSRNQFETDPQQGYGHLNINRHSQIVKQLATRISQQAAISTATDQSRRVQLQSYGQQNIDQQSQIVTQPAAGPRNSQQQQGYGQQNIDQQSQMVTQPAAGSRNSQQQQGYGQQNINQQSQMVTQPAAGSRNSQQQQGYGQQNINQQSQMVKQPAAGSKNSQQQQGYGQQNINQQPQMVTQPSAGSRNPQQQQGYGQQNINQQPQMVTQPSAGSRNPQQQQGYGQQNINQQSQIVMQPSAGPRNSQQQQGNGQQNINQQSQMVTQLAAGSRNSQQQQGYGQQNINQQSQMATQPAAGSRNSQQQQAYEQQKINQQSEMATQPAAGSRNSQQQQGYGQQKIDQQSEMVTQPAAGSRNSQQQQSNGQQKIDDQSHLGVDMRTTATDIKVMTQRSRNQQLTHDLLSDCVSQLQNVQQVTGTTASESSHPPPSLTGRDNHQDNQDVTPATFTPTSLNQNMSGGITSTANQTSVHDLTQNPVAPAWTSQNSKPDISAPNTFQQPSTPTVSVPAEESPTRDNSEPRISALLILSDAKFRFRDGVYQCFEDKKNWKSKENFWWHLWGHLHMHESEKRFCSYCYDVLSAHPKCRGVDKLLMKIEEDTSKNCPETMNASEINPNINQDTTNTSEINSNINQGTTNNSEINLKNNQGTTNTSEINPNNNQGIINTSFTGFVSDNQIHTLFKEEASRENRIESNDSTTAILIDSDDEPSHPIMSEEPQNVNGTESVDVAIEKLKAFVAQNKTLEVAQGICSPEIIEQRRTLALKIKSMFLQFERREEELENKPPKTEEEKNGERLKILRSIQGRLLQKNNQCVSQQEENFRNMAKLRILKEVTRAFGNNLKSAPSDAPEQMCSAPHTASNPSSIIDADAHEHNRSAPHTASNPSSIMDADAYEQILSAPHTASALSSCMDADAHEQMNSAPYTASNPSSIMDADAHEQMRSAPHTVLNPSSIMDADAHEQMNSAPHTVSNPSSIMDADAYEQIRSAPHTASNPSSIMNADAHEHAPRTVSTPSSIMDADAHEQIPSAPHTASALSSFMDADASLESDAGQSSGRTTPYEAGKVEASIPSPSGGAAQFHGTVSASLGVSKPSPSVGAAQFFSCSLCRFSTLFALKFKKHLEEHEDEDLLCMHCGYSSYDLKDFFKHFRGHLKTNLGIATFVCVWKSCKKFQRNKLAEFMHHLKMYHSKDSLTCNCCESVFPTLDTFQEHLQSNLLTIVKCPHCQGKATDKKSMLRHIAKYHPKKGRMISITKHLICDDRKLHGFDPMKMLAFQTEWENQDEGDDEDVEFIEYIEAPPGFASPRSEPQVKKEMESQDASSSPIRRLSESDNQDPAGNTPELPSANEPDIVHVTSFGVTHFQIPSSSLSSFEESVSESTEDQLEYRCHQCSFVAERTSILDDHLYKHRNLHQIDDEKDFSCMFCPTTFNDLMEMENHLQHHDEKISFTVYECTLDGFRTNQLHCLKAHIKDDLHQKHSNLNDLIRTSTVMLESKVSRCSKCDYKGFGKASVMKHEVTHEAPKTSPEEVAVPHQFGTASNVKQGMVHKAPKTIPEEVTAPQPAKSNIHKSKSVSPRSKKSDAPGSKMVHQAPKSATGKSNMAKTKPKPKPASPRSKNKKSEAIGSKKRGPKSVKDAFHPPSVLKPDIVSESYEDIHCVYKVTMGTSADRGTYFDQFDERISELYSPKDHLYHCKVCAKTCKMKRAIHDHLGKHLNIPYLCEICDHEDKQFSLLCTHMKEVHDIDSIRVIFPKNMQKKIDTLLEPKCDDSPAAQKIVTENKELSKLTKRRFFVQGSKGIQTWTVDSKAAKDAAVKKISSKKTEDEETSNDAPYSENHGTVDHRKDSVDLPDISPPTRDKKRLKLKRKRSDEDPSLQPKDEADDLTSNTIKKRKKDTVSSTQALKIDSSEQLTSKASNASKKEQLTSRDSHASKKKELFPNSRNRKRHKSNHSSGTGTSGQNNQPIINEDSVLSIDSEASSETDDFVSEDTDNFHLIQELCAETEDVSKRSEESMPSVEPIPNDGTNSNTNKELNISDECKPSVERTPNDGVHGNNYIKPSEQAEVQQDPNMGREATLHIKEEPDLVESPEEPEILKPFNVDAAILCHPPSLLKSSLDSQIPKTKPMPRQKLPTKTKQLPKQKSPTKTKPLCKQKSPTKTKPLPKQKSPTKAKPLPRQKSPTKAKPLPKQKSPTKAKPLPKQKSPTKSRSPKKSNPMTIKFNFKKSSSLVKSSTTTKFTDSSEVTKSTKLIDALKVTKSSKVTNPSKVTDSLEITNPTKMTDPTKITNQTKMTDQTKMADQIEVIDSDFDDNDMFNLLTEEPEHKMYECDQCTAKFYSILQMQNHQAFLHRSGLKSCPFNKGMIFGRSPRKSPVELAACSPKSNNSISHVKTGASIGSSKSTTDSHTTRPSTEVKSTLSETRLPSSKPGPKSSKMRDLQSKTLKRKPNSMNHKPKVSSLARGRCGDGSSKSSSTTFETNTKTAPCSKDGNGKKADSTFNNSVQNKKSGKLKGNSSSTSSTESISSKYGTSETVDSSVSKCGQNTKSGTLKRKCSSSSSSEPPAKRPLTNKYKCCFCEESSSSLMTLSKHFSLQHTDKEEILWIDLESGCTFNRTGCHFSVSGSCSHLRKFLCYCCHFRAKRRDLVKEHQKDTHGQNNQIIKLSDAGKDVNNTDTNVEAKREVSSMSTETNGLQETTEVPLYQGPGSLVGLNSNNNSTGEDMVHGDKSSRPNFKPKTCKFSGSVKLSDVVLKVPVRSSDARSNIEKLNVSASNVGSKLTVSSSASSADARSKLTVSSTASSSDARSKLNVSSSASSADARCKPTVSSTASSSDARLKLTMSPPSSASDARSKPTVSSTASSSDARSKLTVSSTASSSDARSKLNVSSTASSSDARSKLNVSSSASLADARSKPTVSSPSSASDARSKPTVSSTASSSDARSKLNVSSTASSSDARSKLNVSSSASSADARSKPAVSLASVSDARSKFNVSSSASAEARSKPTVSPPASASDEISTETSDVESYSDVGPKITLVSSNVSIQSSPASCDKTAAQSAPSFKVSGKIKILISKVIANASKKTESNTSSSGSQSAPCVRSHPKSFSECPSRTGSKAVPYVGPPSKSSSKNSQSSGSRVFKGSISSTSSGTMTSSENSQSSDSAMVKNAFPSTSSGGKTAPCVRPLTKSFSENSQSSGSRMFKGSISSTSSGTKTSSENSQSSDSVPSGSKMAPCVRPLTKSFSENSQSSVSRMLKGSISSTSSGTKTSSENSQSSDSAMVKNVISSTSSLEDSRFQADKPTSETLKASNLSLPNINSAHLCHSQDTNSATMSKILTGNHSKTGFLQKNTNSATMSKNILTGNHSKTGFSQKNTNNSAALSKTVPTSNHSKTGFSQKNTNSATMSTTVPTSNHTKTGFSQKNSDSATMSTTVPTSNHTKTGFSQKNSDSATLSKTVPTSKHLKTGFSQKKTIFYNCPFCSYKIHKLYVYSRHLAKHKRFMKVAKKWKCGDCLKIFHRERRLSIHKCSAIKSAFKTYNSGVAVRFVDLIPLLSLKDISCEVQT